MIKQIAGLLVLAATTTVTTADLQQQLDSISLTEMRQAFGVSDTAYQCAADALAGLDADGVEAVINASLDASIARDANTDARIATLTDCVTTDADPFGWGADGWTDDEKAVMAHLFEDAKLGSAF